MKHKSLYFIMFTVFLLLLSGCGGGDSGNGEDRENNGDQQESAESGGAPGDAEGSGEGTGETEIQQGVPVRTEMIQVGEISDGISSTSVIEAEQSVEIYSRVTGTVTSILAEEGDRVRAGDLLCRLEDEDLRLRESKSRAEMDKLKRDLERTKTLVAEKILTETDLNNAQYNYDKAEITWKQDKTSLDYTQIKSTINGTVFVRSVRLGQKVDPSIRLYSLFNPRSLVINVYIPESEYFGKIADNQQAVMADISSESLPGKEFTGRIKRVSPVVDPNTNTIKITLEYTDSENVLRPGMYVRVKLITDTHDRAVLVPKTAILYDENQQYVFIVRDNKAARITLEPGYSDAAFVESLRGVEEGDRIVVVGQNGLKDGTKVRLVEDEREIPASQDQPEQ